MGLLCKFNMQKVALVEIKIKKCYTNFMADFNRNRSRGGFRRGFNNRGSDRPMMHPAVCDKCKQDCEVPFKPTNGKPLYCNNCFDRPTSNRSEERNFNRSSFKQRPSFEEQFALLNSKLDKVLNILIPAVEEIKTTEELTEETKIPEEK